MKLNVLFEDRYIIVVEKPRGVPVQGDKTNDDDLMKIVNKYLQDKTGYDEPYLGLIHRLDRPVGGVVIFAKNKFANTVLSEQIRNNNTEKTYLAVVCGKSNESQKYLEDYVKKLVTINMSKITDEKDKNAKLAKLKYTVLSECYTEEYGNLSLLRVNLYTGRHHQIRVQLSNAGIPIWGDNKYNKVFMKKKEFTNIALWAESYSITHPKSEERLTFESKPFELYPFSLFQENMSHKYI